MEQIKKVKPFWNIEKCERWMNDMCAKGYAVTKKAWIISTLEPCQPGEYIYRAQIMEFSPFSAKKKEYISFIEETGAELVSRHPLYCFFRKKAADGPFDLFSDAKSRLRQYKRLFSLFLCFFLLLLLPYAYLNYLFIQSGRPFMDHLILLPFLVIAVLIGSVSLNFFKAMQRAREEIRVRE